MAHMDGTNLSTNFVDSSYAANSITANGGAVITTAVQEFGTGSGLFPSVSSSFISAANSPLWAIGTNDFTVDFWYRASSFTNSVLLDMGGLDSLNGIGIYLTDSKVLQFFFNGLANYNSGVLTLNALTQYHFAFTRSGGNFRFFQNGVQIGATVVDNTNLTQGAAGLRIGNGFNTYNGLYFDGWLDEYRIVTTTAVWNTNFTPPTAAYLPDFSSGGSVVPVLQRRKLRRLMGVGL